MAKDLLHNAVRDALLNDGWTITHDPYRMAGYDPDWEIDFGAEQVIAAEKEATRIAVEVKSFLEMSFANEFHKILGQYLNYVSGLRRIEPERQLFIAIPKMIFDKEFKRKGISNSVNDYNVKFFIYDDVSKAILRWNL